jgi:hypothetical protein
MQSTENSPENDAADDGLITDNQEAAPAWTSPPVSRPPPHLKAGKVMSTIFHWETGTWQYEHGKPMFGLSRPGRRPLRVPCSLPPPPPPIPRPSADPFGGKAMLVIFYWETGQWACEWENGTRLLARPGPLRELAVHLAAPLSVPRPSLPQPPSYPPHPVHGRAMHLKFTPDMVPVEIRYEDGTILPVSSPEASTSS